MNQRGFQCGLKGEHANALPRTLEAPLMRLTIATLRRVVKGDLTIQFVPQALTSYGGLELLGRYLRQIDLGARLRQAFGGLRSDYGSARIAMVSGRGQTVEEGRDGAADRTGLRVGWRVVHGPSSYQDGEKGN